MHVGLALVDVERGARDQALAKRPGERSLVDHGAAGSVDQVRAALHTGQRRLIDQVAGLRRQGHVQ